jgi:hypothetical protein
MAKRNRTYADRAEYLKNYFRERYQSDPDFKADRDRHARIQYQIRKFGLSRDEAIAKVDSTEVKKRSPRINQNVLPESLPEPCRCKKCHRLFWGSHNC